MRAIAQDERSQLRNRELATERIVEQLREAARAAADPPRDGADRRVAQAAAGRQSAVSPSVKRLRARRRRARRPPTELEYRARCATLSSYLGRRDGARSRAARRQRSCAPGAPQGMAVAAGYSTVTVFARFRGWSTFRPRSRAIR